MPTVLLLPTDAPPRRTVIKRYLLFFEQVWLPSPQDTALINDGEFTEEIVGGSIRHSARSPYVLTPEYVEVLSSIVADTAWLQKRGTVRMVPPRGPTGADPTVHWRAYHQLIAQEALVRSAVPDMVAGRQAPRTTSGVYTGGTLSMAGRKSRFDVGPAQPAFDLQADPAWTLVAWSRIGRTLKYLRRAEESGALPVSVDDPTDGILSALMGCGFAQASPASAQATLAIAAHSGQLAALDAALTDVSWAEIPKLRGVVLPRIEPLTRRLLRRAGSLHALSGSESLSTRLSAIEADFQQLEEAMSAAWRTIGWGGVAAASAFGSLLASPFAWPQFALAVFGGGSALAPGVADYFRVRKQLNAHPVMGLSRLPEVIVGAAVRRV